MNEVIKNAKKLAKRAPGTRERVAASVRALEAEVVNAVSPRRVAVAAPAGQEYVDPFLFETGHFESREEYEELMRTAKIKPRARA